MTNAEGPPQKRLSSFVRVDGEANPDPLFAYLELMDRNPAVVAYRSQALAWVQPATSMLDVGCGVGGFLRQAQEEYPDIERLVGVDRSQQMLTRAHALTSQGGIKYVLGDAHNIPLRAGAFDLVYSERTFQYLEDPGRALKGLAAATRPGGHVFLVEPNWEEFQIQGISSKTISILMRARQSNIPHFDIGSRLKPLFLEAGLTNVEGKSVNLSASGFENASQAFFFDGSLTRAVEGKSVTEKEKAFCLADLQKAGPAIEVSLPLYMVKGMKE